MKTSQFAILISTLYLIAYSFSTSLDQAILTLLFSGLWLILAFYSTLREIKYTTIMESILIDILKNGNNTKKRR